MIKFHSLRRSAVLLSTLSCAGGADDAPTNQAGAFATGTVQQASQCGSTLDTVDVELYSSVITPTTASVRRWQGTTAYIGYVGANCTGTLISHDLLLTAAHCDTAAGDTTYFEYQVDGTAPPAIRVPTSTLVSRVLETNSDVYHDYAIVQLASSPGQTRSWRPIAAYDPAPGTKLTIVQHPNGLPKKVASGPLVSFSSLNTFEHQVDTDFGSSGAGVLDPFGNLVGIQTDNGCRTTTPIGSNTAQRLSSNVSTLSPRLKHIALGLDIASLLADVTNDGKADLVGINDTDVWVMTVVPGGGFASPVLWSSVGIYGQQETLLADMTGDGRADLIAVDENRTRVANAAAASFLAPTVRLSVPFHGFVGTFAGDFNGDGKADLIGVNLNNTWVSLSNGANFGTPTLATSVAFHGQRTTMVANVNGDAYDDLVGINNNDVWVMLSNGNTFDFPVLALGVPFYGQRATRMGDLNGDGRDDLVKMNDTDIWVAFAKNSGSVGFEAPVRQTGLPFAFYGGRGTFVGDIDANGKADLVSVDPSSSWVSKSTSTTTLNPANLATAILSFPSAWASVAFHGNHR